MRARYYSPAIKRFINADVIAGAISNAITLNRFAYANGNPVSFVDPFGLSAERGENNFTPQNSLFNLPEHRNSEFNNQIPLYLLYQKTTYNPWNQLDYPGQIHNLVVNYLSLTYGLIPEYVPKNNKTHRYDLYTYGMYWEVKPVSYLTDPVRAAKMEIQMQGYDADGVARGFPLGYNEFTVDDFTVKIYSGELGKIYYHFQQVQDCDEKQEQPHEQYVMEKDSSKEEVASKGGSRGYNWQPEPETVTALAVTAGIVVILAGIFQLITTGDPSGIQQGTQTIQTAIG